MSDNVQMVDLLHARQAFNALKTCQYMALAPMKYLREWDKAQLKYAALSVGCDTLHGSPV